MREDQDVDLGRSSGILLHPTSLPGGRLGDDAYRFVDWLAQAGQSWWQMLPLGPPDEFGSPYRTTSAFAASPALLGDPQALRVDHRPADLPVLDELPVPAVAGGVALALDVLGAVPVGLAQLVQQRAMARPHRVQLVDAPRGRLEQLLSCERFLLAGAGVLAEAQRADERGQRQPLPDQREDDDRERHDDQRLARRERRAVGHRQRQRERGGERDDAAHSGPGEDRHVRDSQRLRFSQDEPLPSGHAQDPEGANRDERDAHRDPT